MFTTYYLTGQPYIVEDRVNGRRVNKVVIYNATGQEINNLRYVNGKICHISYWQNNTQHNEHDPACISWSTNGKIYRISYWQNDLRHNLHVPTYMEWFRSNDKICYITYWQNNELHNLHGPAFIHCSRNGKIYRIEYYHFNKLIKEY